MGFIQNGNLINNNKNASVNENIIKGMSIQGKIVYELSSDTFRYIDFDFANLSNIKIVDGIWDNQQKEIFNTEILAPLQVSINFDFQNLSNVKILDGNWDNQQKNIFNTEIAKPINLDIDFDFVSLQNIKVVEGIQSFNYKYFFNTEVIN